MTTFNDGPILGQSIRSVLNQTYSDFEFILVDDGSNKETKDIISDFFDPRLIILPQANDGLSSARNRAMQHASGDVICFLDGDDVRAPWAFARAVEEIQKSGAELLFVEGAFSGERTGVEPFFDTSNYRAWKSAIEQKNIKSLELSKVWASTLEPQSANKYIRRDVISRAQLRFPNDHFFEDILFHALCIVHAQSISFLEGVNFTYFQRALHSQLTSGNSMRRFDVLGTAQVALQLFQNSPDFKIAHQRGAMFISIMRLVEWCETCISSYHKFAFRVALKESLRGLNPLYFIIDPGTPDPRGDKARLSNYIERVIA